jgi:sugar phosphate isomerase/epimerase
MRLGIFAKTFPGDTAPAVMSAARAAGYDAVQYNMACSGLSALPQAIPDEAVSALREASEATGVGVAALSATYNMIHPDPAVRDVGRAAFAAIAGAARELGTEVVTVCSGSRDPRTSGATTPTTLRPRPGRSSWPRCAASSFSRTGTGSPSAWSPSRATS